MKPLLLGLGLQGKATLHDLEASAEVERIVVADLAFEPMRNWIASRGYRKSRAVAVDAADGAALESLIRSSGCDIVVCMLPATVGAVVAAAAIATRKPFVSTSYAGAISDLDQAARDAGVVVLPEMGFDPGIDLVLARLAIDELDTVERLDSYGAGVPEASAADNPLKYKVTWTLDGVLKAYKRDARIIRGGRVVTIPGSRIFHAENVHMIDVPGVGRLEAYFNGDAVHFAEIFKLGSGLVEMGRYAARWPGHCAFWSKLADLGFLSDDPISVNGARVAPRDFLVAHLTPQLQFAPDERDIAILRVEASGRKAGRPCRIAYDLVDYRDLETGFFAMNRTVGYTASIAAHLVARGEVARAGVLSPTHDVPGARVLDELARRGIRVVRQVLAPDTQLRATA
ncbi:MAG: saccharopine dehydrogenase family protein [Acidobacteriota bacterium]